MATLRIRRVARARIQGMTPAIAQISPSEAGRRRSFSIRCRSKAASRPPYLPGQGSLQRHKDDHAAALAAPAGRRRAQEVLRDTAATRVERALDYVRASTSRTTSARRTWRSTRCAASPPKTFSSTASNIARGYNGSPDTQNVQSIEVLKGPSGALYGRSDPGGTVNILTKQPVALPFVEMGKLFGSFGTARTGRRRRTIERGGHRPLRFNGALARQDSFRDFVDGDRVLVAPW